MRVKKKRKGKIRITFLLLLTFNNYSRRALLLFNLKEYQEFLILGILELIFIKEMINKYFLKVSVVSGYKIFVSSLLF